MRRKGEKKVETAWSDYALRSIRRMMETGDSWFHAWHVQAATPYPKMSKRARISEERLWEIGQGSPVTREELEALCRAWKVEPEKVLATIPAGVVVRE